MERPAIAWGEVTVDCLDTARVAEFWGELLDAPTEQQKSGWFRVGPLVAGGPLINFQPVPERKVGKTRIHIDLWTDDLDSAVAFAEQLGGHRLGEMGADPEGVGFVMADPEGNEFCLVALPP
jgi:predicted enzyme related to lactoylglutathione lyase